MEKVLIVEDDKDVRDVLSQLVTLNKYIAIGANDGREALEFCKRENPSAVLLDLNLPDSNGLQILGQMKVLNPDLPVIIVTGLSDVEVAVESIKLGAYDFIVKPVKVDRIILTLNRAIENAELSRQVKQLATLVGSQLEHSLGRSISIQTVIQQVKQVAASAFSVIIEGETGSGKNFVARLIHDLSKRVDGPFVSIDVGAIPESLIESELFGYEKGAYTGAERTKCGLFELAEGGTIIIDELQNMSPLVQSKLLKVVEEKRFYRLGSTVPVAVDVRIIACTNMDIKQAVVEKKFREDLFFRLGEFIIHIPPLRERVDDIAYLAQKFFREAAEELDKPLREITDGAKHLLSSYKWPGNVRELKNVIRRAALLSTDGILRSANISFLLNSEHGGNALSPITPLKELSALAVKDVESKAINAALQQTLGNKTQAARLLKIDYKTLLTKIKEYNISN
ncbi:MAG: sigma-54-dependent transcriptional regulator [Dissulfurispiraceae bacterium]